MNETKTVLRQPTFYIPHGGGPCFFMDWPSGNPWEELGSFLRTLAQSIETQPQAIVVVSAHWEAEEFTVNTAEKPTLLYDYYGFPEDTYHLRYDVDGSLQLTVRIQSLLSQAGLTLLSDKQRGLDHGVFVPFMLVYPQANIPIVQLSLRRGLDPAEHIRVGQALESLRDEGVLIVGSGMSFHNLHAFSPAYAQPSRRFDDWLTDVVTQPSARQRYAQLEQWSRAPDARLAHPREEHLLPLMVVAGAGGNDVAQRVFCGQVRSVAISGYRFG